MYWTSSDEYLFGENIAQIEIKPKFEAIPCKKINRHFTTIGQHDLCAQFYGQTCLNVVFVCHFTFNVLSLRLIFSNCKLLKRAFKRIFSAPKSATERILKIAPPYRLWTLLAFNVSSERQIGKHFHLLCTWLSNQYARKLIYAPMIFGRCQGVNAYWVNATHSFAANKDPTFRSPTKLFMCSSK